MLGDVEPLCLCASGASIHGPHFCDHGFEWRGWPLDRSTSGLTTAETIAENDRRRAERLSGVVRGACRQPPPSPHVAGRRRVDYRRWKRQLVVERWRWYRDHGFTRLLPRATLALRVREDLDWIAREPPSKVWRSCPCHAQPRQQRDAPMPEAHGLDYIRTRGAAGRPMTRQQRWRLDHLARGLCRMCSRPRHPQSTDSCWEHLVSRRLRTRRRLGLKAWHPGGLGRPPLRP